MSDTVIQDGIIAGNYSDKYESKNPIARYFINGFLRTLELLVEETGAGEIHEIGCGEGYLSRFLAKKGFKIRGTDFSEEIIEIAKRSSEPLPIQFKVGSIYELDPERDSASLVLCCEVLEHLENPERALELIKTLANPYFILSVPREPLWRFLNMMRGKYISDLGNTPGHLQHWSKQSFLRMLKKKDIKILKVLSPLPWTFVLCER